MVHELYQRYILILWDDSLFQVGQCHCSAVLICAQQEWLRLFPCQYIMVIGVCLSMCSAGLLCTQMEWLFPCPWQVSAHTGDQCLSVSVFNSTDLHMVEMTISLLLTGVCNQWSVFVTWHWNDCFIVAGKCWKLVISVCHLLYSAHDTGMTVSLLLTSAGN